MRSKKQTEKEKKEQKENRKKWNSTHIKILIFLTIIGFYLRIEPILLDDVIFSYDQGVDISYVRQLVENNKISLISRFTGLEGVFMGPFWTWFLAIPYLISGGNPSANVFFLSLFGIGAIWLTYALVKKMLNETAAIISAFYVAVSNPFLAASHVVLSPVALTILMVLYIWFLWEIIEHKNNKFFAPLGFFAGLFFQFEIGFAIFLVPATIITLMCLKKTKSIISIAGLKGLILFLIPFLPQIIFDFRHNFLISKSILGFFSGENSSLGSQHAGFLERIAIRVGSLTEDYSFSTAFIGTNLLFVALITIPALFGWWKIIKKRDIYKLRFAVMLLTLTTMIYLGFAIYPGPVWVWYRSGMPIVYILLIVMGWSQLIRIDKRWKIAAIVTFSILAFFGVNPKKLAIRALGKDEGGVVSIRNQKNALDTVFKDAKDQPFDLYVYTPPVYTYVWDHILLWYAQPKYKISPEDYGYQRETNATNDFYLLIEPDNIPVRIDGWKGNFVSHGEQVKKWRLPGNIIIEKWKANHSQ